MPHSTSSQLAALLLLAVAAVAAAVAVDTELPLEAPLQKRHHKDHPGAGGDPGFDLFVFVRSYSPTFCKETACSIRPITAFTIHGLWPEYANGGWPQFCGDVEADEGVADSSGSHGSGGEGGAVPAAGQQQLAAVEQEAGKAGLERQRRHHKRHRRQRDDDGDDSGGDAPSGGGGDEPEPPAPTPPEPPVPPPPGPAGEESEQQKCEWPSFKGPDGGFWDHEWEKHGTCARPITGTRPAFFNAAMQLHEAFDLDVALAAAGILPSDDSAYSIRSLSSAVEDAFGVAPLLSCFHGQLLEVWLCVGLDLKVRTCPPGVLKAHRPTCGKTVSLPVGSPVPPQCRPYFPPWEAPNSGNHDNLFVRIATGAAVVGAGAAAVLLFVRGALQGRHRQRLPEGGVEGEQYDPLGSWLQNSQAIRPPRQPAGRQATAA